MTRNREAAKELTASTISTAWETFETVKDKKAFLSFLFTIASRKYANEIRKKQREQELEFQDISRLYSNSVSPEDASEIALLYDALEKINSEQKEAIILSDITGFKIDEIAEIQKVSQSAVKMRIKRGKENLRDLLGIKINKGR
jgi:RNA polymerase sigma-70 factor (ECF subfamily)